MEENINHLSQRQQVWTQFNWFVNQQMLDDVEPRIIPFTFELDDTTILLSCNKEIDFFWR